MEIKHAHEIPAEEPGLAGTTGCSLRWLITKKDGAQHYAMRLFELQPEGTIPLHLHDDIEHEIFIIEGEAQCADGECTKKVTSGDVIFVRPGEKHGFHNVSDRVFRFICVIPAG